MTGWVLKPGSDACLGEVHYQSTGLHLTERGLRPTAYFIIYISYKKFTKDQVVKLGFNIEKPVHPIRVLILTSPYYYAC